MQVTPAQWLDHVVSGLGRFGTEELPIGDAHGRVLAEDALARYDLPLWNNSAMDGYALRSADAATATPEHPFSLDIVGEVLAGSAADPSFGAGQAVRIMTGAPVPTDADAVVPFEHTDCGERTSEHEPDSGATDPWRCPRISLHAPVKQGANIRRRGEDIEAGAVIATRGDHLTAAKIAALAASGVDTLHTHRSPRVAIISTGAELTPPGSPLERGQIPESNSLLIAGLLRECGVEPVSVRSCPDDAKRLAALLEQLARGCDVVITTGGIGPGSKDIVRAVLDDEPLVRRARVAVRPGKHQCAGRLAAGPYIFALPGNPVSAACSFELFVRPALLAAQGRSDVQRRRFWARAASGWRGAESQLQVLPVRLAAAERPGDPLTCAPAVHSRGVSHAVGGHSSADAYALVEAGRGDIAAGEIVEVMVVAN